MRPRHTIQIIFEFVRRCEDLQQAEGLYMTLLLRFGSLRHFALKVWLGPFSRGAVRGLQVTGFGFAVSQIKGFGIKDMAQTLADPLRIQTPISKSRERVLFIESVARPLDMLDAHSQGTPGPWDMWVQTQESAILETRVDGRKHTRFPTIITLCKCHSNKRTAGV